MIQKYRKKQFSFRFINVPVEFTQDGLIGSVILWVLLLIAALVLTDLTPLDAIIAGFFGVVIHWLLECAHQYGHYLAGRSVGYPMQKMKTWWIVMMGLYSRDEPELAPTIHLRRALGGAILSGILGIVLFVLAAMLWQVGGMLRFWLGYALLLDIGVMTIGAFIPIKLGDFMTDGATILHYMRLRDEA